MSLLLLFAGSAPAAASDPDTTPTVVTYELANRTFPSLDARTSVELDNRRTYQP